MINGDFKNVVIPELFILRNSIREVIKFGGSIELKTTISFFVDTIFGLIENKFKIKNNQGI